MKVLMQNRQSYQHSIAGDSIQLVKTQEYLKRSGVEAVISADPEHDLGDYDLVHLFNLMPVEETYQFYQNAVRQRKKMVLSPIFWNPGEFLRESGGAERFGEWWQKTMPFRKEILTGVQLILPNSETEVQNLHETFGELPPVQIVPNAADRLFFNARPERFRRAYQPPAEFLLSVGRISPRKNQLALVKVVQKLGIPAIFVGPLNDTVYYQECRRNAAGGKISFIDTLSQVELASAYAAAKVHALVSWYDTPGLVSLEAGLTGCRIVSTDRGTAREYLGDDAYYCAPDNIQSIIHAIRTAWHDGPKRNQLKERILARFTWEQAAKATLVGYRKVLQGEAKQ